MATYYERNKDIYKNVYYPRVKEQRRIKRELNKKVNRYENGKIYKIIDNTNGDIYIGSTIQSLNDRLRNHLTDSRHRTDITSRKIILNKDYKIELIETYPCNSLKELLYREQYYIEKIKCINKHNSYTNKLEYNRELKNKNKDYINFVRRQNRLWGDSLWRIGLK